MADLEPSLGELASLPVNAALGGGVPTPVIDNSRMVDELNQNARFNAENTWRKYQSFLQNKTDLFKNIGEIQGLDTLAEDKPGLAKQAGDILGDIAKNPSVVMGGQGYDEIQQKIGQLKSQSMLSKQNNLDTTADKLFLERNPELQTEDNMKLLNDYRTLPLGQRKTVQLQLPTVFDEKNAFEGLLKDATKPYSSVVGKDGKSGDGYIETGNEVNPKTILQNWGLGFDTKEDKYGHSIKKAVADNYSRLSDDEKKKYEDEGGDPIKNYYLDRGQKYLDAYLPQGSYEQTQSGNYRFGKTLKDDPAYLGKEKLNLDYQKLGEETKYHNAEIKARWGAIGLGYARLNKGTDEDLGGTDAVLHTASSAINNGEVKNIVDQQGKPIGQVIRISDPNLLKKFQSVDKQGNISDAPSAINFDPKTSQVSLIYGEVNKNTGVIGTSTHPFKEIKIDQRLWLNTIANDAYPKKDVGGISNNIEKLLKNNSLYDISQKYKKLDDGTADASPQTAQPKSQNKAKPKTTAKGAPIL